MVLWLLGFSCQTLWASVSAHLRGNVVQVLSMLKERVQTEALRTYLFANGLHYSSVSLAQLSATFQLPSKKVLHDPCLMVSVL